MKTKKINGATFAYEDSGSGDDVVLLVHGHPFNRSMWAPQIDYLSRNGWRVVAPDLRGYGDSTGASDKTLLGDFANDLVALLDHLGVERCVAGGLSMGGQIVMELCRSHLARLRAIILAATFPQADTEQRQRSRYATAARIEAEGMWTYGAELLPTMLAPATIKNNSALARTVLAMMQQTPSRGAAAALRGRAERVDYSPVLADTDLPALIVAGAQDSFTSRPEAERLHELMRRSQLVWFEECGHMPNLEMELPFNTALGQFLGSLNHEACQ